MVRIIREQDLFTNIWCNSTSQSNSLNGLAFNGITRKGTDNLSSGRNTLQTPAAEELFVIFSWVYNKIRLTGRIDEQMFIKN